MATASTSFSKTAGAALEFKTLLESHAYISYLKAKRSRNYKIKNFLLKGTDSEYEKLRFEIIWENAVLRFQDPVWTFPKNNILDSARNVYETEYKNSLSSFEVTNEHTNKTEAVFSLALLEGNTSGLDLNASIKLPDETMEVFGETTVLNINRPSFETHQNQEWKLSVKVPIPANQKAKLVTVIHKKSFKGTFNSRAFLRGKVSVRIFKKKNGELLNTVTDDVIDFWRKIKQQMSLVYTTNPKSIVTRLAPFQALSDDSREISWLVSGECSFTVGTHGSIDVQPVERKPTF
ncbi:hypothetical protein BsWGS_08133 [Bradybaena similaris]